MKTLKCLTTLFFRSLLVAALLPPQALAYIKQESPFKISIHKELKSANSLRLRLSKQELLTKKDLLKLKKSNRRKFDKLAKATVDNPVDYQSYIFEVRDGLAEIETAKLVAQRQLYQAIKDNWEEVRKTVLNDIAAPNWKTFEPRLKERLQNLTYFPSRGGKKGSKDIVFLAEDWGAVKIIKDGKSYFSSWELDITSIRDENALEPGAENIKTEPSAGGGAPAPAS